MRAHVATTAGRDGSIDIYIDASPDGMETFQGWPLPLILECKDHDESSRDPARNVDEGWRRVREKLTRQAHAGWRGDFAPWCNARSYVYCVSTHLIQAAREDLQRKIETFFSGLPDNQRPPLEQVVALDWADARGWLDRLPRVADAWLGTGLDSLVGHEQFLGELGGLRQFLLPEALLYVPSEADSETHPERLFATLVDRAGRGGVLIVGVGGVGKTRLALEVGTLAARTGWSVLHARPGDARLEVDSLAAAVMGRDTPTLVVFEYLDQMLRLDPGALRHRLLPEAFGRGQPIALLATARPGAAMLDNAEWSALLAPLRLALSPAHAEAITGRMRSQLAPRAESILGSTLLRELTGRRPILTLFLCRELERRAEDGLLDPARIDDLREADLLSWLRRRLAENNMLVREGGGLIPPEPERDVVAAAAVLAAAPQSRAELIAVAVRVLGVRATLAELLVETLARFGWLERSQGEWSAAHDVVADEVLEQVVRLRQGDALWPGVLPIVLLAAVGAPRTLGRFAVALRRLIFANAGTPGFTQVLGDAARDWLRRFERELAPGLASADPDEASYALGAVIAGPPWQEVALERWDSLLGPLLDRWGTERSARHLLYTGLRSASLSSRLVEQACAWLAVNVAEREATFVLSPMLKRLGPGKPANEAIRRGLDWLRRFPMEPESEFVLTALLVRDDLGLRAQETIQRSLDWLRRFPLEPESGFVLHPLLAHQDLRGQAQEAIQCACDWLRRFPLERESQFVLSPLLTRKDLGEQAQEAIQRGCDWLRRFPLEPESQFVLSPLLTRKDLGEQAQEAIQRGFEWLQRFPLEPESQFLLSRLLARRDLGKQAQQAIRRGCDWLQRFPLMLESEFVLRPLLEHQDLGEQAQEAIQCAFDWLQCFPLGRESQFVLGPLLARKDLGARASDAISCSLDWLRHFPLEPESQFVLSPLLARKDLGARASDAISCSLDWLRRFPLEPESQFVLSSLLARKDLGARASDAISCSRDWLHRFPFETDSCYVLAPLLSLPGHVESSPTVIRMALAWLERHPRLEMEASFVLPPLLKREDLGSASRDTFDRALEWMRRFPNSVEAGFILPPLLKRRDLDLDQEAMAVKVGLEFSENNPLYPELDFVLNRLLRRPSLSDADWRRAARQALAWLRRTPHNRRRDRLLISCLTRSRLLTTDELDWIIQDAIEWQRVIGSEKADRQLSVAIHKLRAPGDDRTHVIRTEALLRLAEDRAALPDAALRAGIAQESENLKAGSLGTVGDHLVPLLPLSFRRSDREMQKAVRGLARRWLEHPDLLPRQRAGFVRECRRLLISGAWTQAEAALQILRELGLSETELEPVAAVVADVPAQSSAPPKPEPGEQVSSAGEA